MILIFQSFFYNFNKKIVNFSILFKNSYYLFKRLRKFLYKIMDSLYNEFNLITNNNPNIFNINYLGITYRLKININEKYITFVFKRHLSPNRFEGIFTIDDFRNMNKIFLLYNTLDEIQTVLISKISKQEIYLSEEDDVLLVDFIFKLDNDNVKVRMKIIKSSEIDLNSHVDDLSQTISLLLSRVDKLEKIQSENEMKKTIERSQIVKLNEIETIREWIFKKCEFKLIYRSSKHGKLSSDFHRRCDDKGPTICFIESTDGNRFGGFTHLNWDQSGSYKTVDYTAFLFSLDKNVKLKINNHDQVIYCHSNYGPIFGGGHDISIGNNHLACYSALPHSYGLYDGYSKFFFTAKKEFNVKELEIYQCKF